MEFSLVHIRFDCILCKLDDSFVKKEGDYPQLKNLIEIISEETAETLLYLHPMVVTPYRSDDHPKARYLLLTGLQSYLLARSLLDGNSVPVMVAQSAPSPDLHMINQLLARPLLSIDDQLLIKFWDYWGDDQREHLPTLGTKILRKETESKLVGLKESTIRKIRREAKPSWRRRDETADKSMSQPCMFGDEEHE